MEIILSVLVDLEIILLPYEMEIIYSMDFEEIVLLLLEPVELQILLFDEINHNNSFGDEEI